MLNQHMTFTAPKIPFPPFPYERLVRSKPKKGTQGICRRNLVHEMRVAGGGGGGGAEEMGTTSIM